MPPKSAKYSAQHSPKSTAQINRQRDTLKKLKSRAREVAVEFAVAPEVLLQSKDYELLVREAAGESIKEPVPWSGWRGEAVVKALRARLSEMAG